MKTLKLLIFVPALLLMNFTAGPGLTDAERKAAADHLNMTKDKLLTAVKGLSTAQLNFKATPESWSIAECVEHITIAENMIFGMAQGAMSEEADPSKRAEIKMTDDQIVGMITDRTNKVKTQEPFEPKNTFGSYEGTLKEFKSKRSSNIDYVKKRTMI
ncbi:MAG: DinB family protein [Flammeovirgaceae bacterium]|nr:DinB family protein [Flammeovirgaceae bacterium]